jgi:subtilisin-like proprotein convertase family protein
MVTPLSNLSWSGRRFQCCAFTACLLVFSSSASGDIFWVDTAELSDSDAAASQSQIPSLPSEGRPVVFDLEALRFSLQNVSKGVSTPTVITFPEPNGASRDFVVKRSRVLPDALAARFPDILAFEGFAEDDPTITIRFELDRFGVSAQVLEPGARWMVDPYPKLKDGLAISYYSGKTKRVSRDRFCEFESRVLDEDEEQHSAKKHFVAKAAAKSSGTQLRTYRLAVATTGEYGQFHGGETTSVLSAVTTTINRVVGILEKEMSISLVLVDNNDQILFTSPTTDPFTGNDDAGVLIDESQTQIDLIIGSENYDVGHTFSTGAGGLASLGSVCSAASKAQGVTGSSQPQGDYFDVDFVAHELGHQFGGNHTFNGSNGACTGGNRYYLTAYEPGSGSTIQAYPSLCGPDDLQNAVDPIYHSVSFDEMYGFVSEGGGASCGMVEDTANTPPTVDAGNDFNVPYGTPLVITGSASDIEQSNLTFMWEQRDLGPQAALSAPDDGEIPLFRVLTPSDSPIRYLPEFSAVLSGEYSSAEKIPQVAREMDFRLTVRDGAGGVSSDDILVNVSGSAGPFALLSPNGGESVGETTTVTWDVADTNLSPINTESVEILLSTDGGLTFDVSLGTTANDGSATVNFPSNLQTGSARLQIKAQDNIYYDVSDENFVLDSDRSVPTAPVDTAVEPAIGGAVVTFSAGPANGVDVTSYVVSCSAEATSQEFMYSAEPGLPFSELAPVSSVLTVTDAITAQTNGLKVPVDISHTYRGDVIIELTSPEGTKVRLKSELGSDSGENVVGTYPDSLAPEESLDLFDGEAAQGDWTLDVSDGFDADSGTFNSWGLTFTSVTPGAEASATGTSSPITVTGMTNGETYQCSITAYSGDDPSETVVIGNVTPSATTYTVTPEASIGSSISPSTPQPVTEGATTSFEISADVGYSISVGGSCGGALSGSTYTTNPVFENCTVGVVSMPLATEDEYTVTPSAGPGGSIVPDSPFLVVEGETVEFEVSPDSGFEIDSVSGTCGGTLAESTFTTAAITAPCTVIASFAELPPTTYTVTPSAGNGGSISPSTPQTVEEGSATAFVLTAYSGYEIESIGGTCGGTFSDTLFTTSPVSTDCTVDVLYRTNSVSDNSTEGGLPVWLIFIANEPAENQAKPD